MLKITLLLLSSGLAVAAAGARASLPVPTEPVLVDDLVEVSYPAGARFSRRTATLNAPARVTNSSGRTLFGPLRLTVSDVGAGLIGPLDPDGSDAAGDYFELIPEGGRFRPGQSAEALLRFSTAARRARPQYDTAVTANTLEVGAPGILPLGLPAGQTSASLRIAVTVDNPAGDTQSVIVERVGGPESAVLNDAGTGGDNAAGDGVYGGLLNVDYSALTPGDCVALTATAGNPLQSRTSPPGEVCVTAVPIGAAGAVTQARLPIGDGEAVSDEALVQLIGTAAHPNVETRLAELAGLFDFEPVGFIPPGYQIRFLTPFANAQDFLDALAALSALDEVVLAVPNIVATPLIFDPATTPQASPDTTQDGFSRIRAGNAWHIARGQGVNIHVIDSGYDATHTDLDEPNLAGDPDTEPGAHGTKVLGILAAQHGNGLGISGVTRGAAVTATDFLAAPCAGAVVGAAVCSLNPSMGQLMAAIRAAWAAGARIVSVQFGVPLAAGVTPLYMCPFIDADLDGATEKRLLIAAAGEGGSSPTNQFPAACNDGAFSGFPLTRPERLIAVAATEKNSDNLWTGNPTGYTQDIAAPGVNITTTDRCTAPGCATLATVTGTSFAAPFVTGAAAAMLSKGIDADNVQGLMQTSGASVAASALKRLDMLAALQAGNTPPDALNDIVGLSEGQFVDINLLGNDTDPDDNASHPDEIVIGSLQILTSPAHGTLGAVSNGTVRYTHTNVSATGATQNDSFSYRIWDTSGAFDTASAQITVTLTNDAPVLNITAPASGFSVTDGTAITFTATASDEESGNLAGSISWSSSIDASLGSGASVSPVLSVGTHLVTASVTDGNTPVTDTVTVTVNADQPPTVSISSPGNGASFPQGASIAFLASATDNEDGNLNGSISWSSNFDGNLGSGGTLNVSTLSVNTHTITAEVIDSFGNTAETTVTVTVTPAGSGGNGTATIDGVIGAGEYAGAATFALTVNLPGGGTTPGTVFIQNDATNLYIAVRFARSVVDTGNSFVIEFDNDNDGDLSSGDDGIVLNPSLSGVLRDNVRISQAEDPVACTSPSLCGVFDTEVGGTRDGAGAFVNAGGFNVYEFSHPLNSGDARDFALGSGDTIPVILLSIRMIDATNQFGDTDLFNPFSIQIQ